MKLSEAFEYKGYWWLPSEPEVKVAGVLSSCIYCFIGRLYNGMNDEGHYKVDVHFPELSYWCHPGVLHEEFLLDKEHKGQIISLSFEDEDMKKEDSNERRLYVTSEFNADGRYMADPTIGVRNAKELTLYLDRKNEKIYDHDVVNIKSKSLALSKENFATNILNSVPPFDSVDFSGFRVLFERLKSVL